MKHTRNIFCVAVAFLIISVTANAAEHDINIRLGVVVPVEDKSNNPGKPSLDYVVGFNIGIVRYFALGFESGLNWVTWKTWTGSQRDSGNPALYPKKEADALTMPFLINAVIRFDMRDQWFIMPYLAPGVGYGMTYLRHPDGDGIYHGFTWQLMAGISIRLPDVKYVEFLIEGGYRGALYKDKHKVDLDMSGMVFHAGVRFPIGK